MEINEFIESIKKAEIENGNFYAHRPTLIHLYSDIEESIEEGYSESIEVALINDALSNSGSRIEAKCEDGTVKISSDGEKLHFSLLPKHQPKRTNRALSPYECTRAAVYAIGNRWAIENFNATH